MQATISTIQPISQLPSMTQQSNESKSVPVIQSQIESPVIKDINSITEISPAIAATDDELACFHATRYILQSHKSRLSSDDIAYAANYISSFYSHSMDIVQKDPDTENILSEEQLIMFLVYADQKGISKFALIFNEELDTAILKKDTISLKAILLGPKEMFVELYDNTFLRNEDRDFLIRLVSREIFALKLTFELLKRKVINLDTIDDTCMAETLTVHAEKLSQEKDKVQVTVIATKCYDEVCIQDAKILEDDMARATMSKYEKPAESVYTVDKSATSTTPKVYCFNTIELIDAITELNPINPKTKEPFSDYTLSLLHQRFHKEMAMYRRYKQIKSSKGEL